MLNINNTGLENNANVVLLANIRINWNWIFFLQEEYLKSKSINPKYRIIDLCEAKGITGSNINSSVRLVLQAYSPSYIHFLNSIKGELIVMVNEFFKSKIINDIYIICSSL